MIEAFNELIAKNLASNRRTSVVKQDDVIDLILDKAQIRGFDDVNRRAIFDSNWLDVEPIYEQSGWKVVYDKPAYCESYPATFTFTAKE